MKRILVYFILFLSCLASCDKAWLEEKPDKLLVVPTTLDDFQALLDNSEVMNKTIALGEIAVDDYYVKDEVYGNLTSAVQKNSYIWKKENLYEGALVEEWGAQYKKILTCNVVIEGIKKIIPESQTQTAWDNIKGSAMFYRAYAFYQLVQTFSPPYSHSSAETSLGIPLRLNTNVEDISTRPPLADVYEQLIADLESAVLLLPNIATVQTRPSKASAFALLARVYLDMENYEKALENATSSLDLYNVVIDYNAIDVNAATPFPRFNAEVIMDSFLTVYSIMISVYHTVDTAFYDSYTNNDLRRSAFFSLKGNTDYMFKGSYGGPAGLAGILWGGIATNEVYLMRAECLARTGNIDQAMSVLNTLMIKRYQKDSFIPFSASSSLEALNIILRERRKELPFRGIRFADLRRLNRDTNFAVTLRRKIQNRVHELPPNDLRYTYPIPDNIIALTGMEQNPR